ncbi:hypothetical protein ACLOJK_009933 [Asimina triloba]
MSTDMLLNALLVLVSKILSTIIKQIFETIVAAKDVLFEKESFEKLTSYLEMIIPVLRELIKKNVQSSESLNNVTRKYVILLSWSLPQSLIVILDFAAYDFQPICSEAPLAGYVGKHCLLSRLGTQFYYLLSMLGSTTCYLDLEPNSTACWLCIRGRDGGVRDYGVAHLGRSYSGESKIGREKSGERESGRKIEGEGERDQVRATQRERDREREFDERGSAPRRSGLQQRRRQVEIGEYALWSSRLSLAGEKMR